MKIQTFNKKEKKEFETKLKERFGIVLPRCQLIKGGKGKIRIFTGDFSEHELNIINGIIRIETIGMYFAQIDKNADIRLSFAGSNLFECNKNIIELDEKQMKRWLQGEDLSIKVKKGYVLLEYNNIIIGCGKATGEKILNFVPKEKRIY